jgi:glucose-6-phosphate 1-dehydrogenase
MQLDKNNYFRFRLGPDLSLSLGARVKCPGTSMQSLGATTGVELSAVNEKSSDEDEAYERLLTDAMHGDQLLFVRQDAVEAAWTIVEPILGDVTPVHMYEPGTWGPAQADLLANHLGGWNNPEPAETS